jgi:hypothetical protein
MTLTTAEMRPTSITAQLAFPDLFEDRLATDGAHLEVLPMPVGQARSIAEQRHYMHRKPMASHAFGLYEDGAPVGVVTFGTPASRHLQMGACPSSPSAVIELNRLWVDDAMPKNTESWFVSRALRQMPPMIVVSYADTAHNHMGYVYRALNFRYAGWTDMERRTPRLDYIPLNEGAHTRESSRSGVKAKVRRKPKVKYWITTGNRVDRARLQMACGWASLDWRTLPPPTEHVHPQGGGVNTYTVGQIVRHDSGKARITFGPFTAISGPPRYVIEFVDGLFVGKGIAVGADIIRPLAAARPRSGGGPC